MIVGGTGLLGSAAAAHLLAAGHDVTVASRSASVPGPVLPALPDLAGAPRARLDVVTATSRQLQGVIDGHDALVYAVGPDEREPYPAPAAPFLQARMIEPTRRTLLAAKAAGVQRCVLMGSYFATWDRMNPGQGLAARHPYIAARVSQSEIALALAETAGGSTMAVNVLEIPYVFGSLPGRPGVFKEWVFDRVRRNPVVLYPEGGSTVVSLSQVAQATEAALQTPQVGRRFPIGDADWTWNHLIAVIADGLGVRRRVVNVPRAVAEPVARRMAAEMQLRGRYSGLNPRHLMRDIMYRRMFLPFEASRAVIGYERGGVEAAIASSLRLCYPGRGSG